MNFYVFLIKKMKLLKYPQCLDIIGFEYIYPVQHNYYYVARGCLEGGNTDFATIFANSQVATKLVCFRSTKKRGL